MRGLLYVMAIVPLLAWLSVCYQSYLWFLGRTEVLASNTVPLMLLLGLSVGVVCTFYAFAMNDAKIPARARLKWTGVFVTCSVVAPLIWLVSQRLASGRCTSKI